MFAMKGWGIGMKSVADTPLTTCGNFVYDIIVLIGPYPRLRGKDDQ
jgi:hypothetical protein